MREKADKESFLLRMPADLKEGLLHLAKGKGMTLTGMITSILWEYIEKEREMQTCRGGRKRDET